MLRARHAIAPSGLSAGRLLALAALIAIAATVAILPGGLRRESAQAQTVPTADPDGAYTVPSDWALIPAGVESGQTFRLLFMTTTWGDATSTDIGTYDTHVQSEIGRTTGNANQIAHPAIRPYASLFRVVGSTALVDARDHTNMNPATDGTGERIWWLNGPRVARDYQRFWQDTWVNWDEADRRNQQGTQPGNDWAFTGTNNDGTKSSQPLGNSGNVTTGRFREDNSSRGPLNHMTAPNTQTHSFYGISPVFRMGGPVTVPQDWALIPMGVTPGDSFRLLFISSTTRDGTSSDIADYNSFAQARAAAGHAAIQPYSALFQALASTSAVDARDNTMTTGAGEPIYWLDGNKLADNYADFYDGTWDDYGRTDESGSTNSNSVALTGSNTDGTKHATESLGATTVRTGSAVSGSDPITSGNSSASQSLRFYAFSPVFTVGIPEISVALPTGEGVNRRDGALVLDEAQGIDGAVFTVTVTPPVPTALTICINVTEAGGDRVAAGSEGARTLNIPGGDRTVVDTITWTDTPDDEINSLLTLAVVAPSDSSCSQTGYTVSATAGSDTALIEDDEATLVTLTAADSLMTEGNASDVAEVTVTLSRRLLDGEIVVVPMSLFTQTGARRPGESEAGFTVTAAGTSVAGAGLDTVESSLTFTGSSSITVQTATVTFTPNAGHDDDDNDHELISLAINAALLTGTGATNVGGGAARGTPHTALLTINDDDSATRPGSVVVADTSLRISENGGSGTYVVWLTGQPTADVTATITRGGAQSGAATLGATSLTFTATGASANWWTPQMVTVSAVDEANMRRNRALTLSHAFTSSDSTYNNVSASVNVEVLDAPKVDVFERSGIEWKPGYEGQRYAIPPQPVSEIAWLRHDTLVYEALDYSVAISNRPAGGPVTVTATVADFAKAGLSLTRGGAPQQSVTMTFTDRQPANGSCNDDRGNITSSSSGDLAYRCWHRVWLVRTAAPQFQGCTDVTHTASGGGARTSETIQTQRAQIISQGPMTLPFALPCQFIDIRGYPQFTPEFTTIHNNRPMMAESQGQSDDPGTPSPVNVPNVPQAVLEGTSSTISIDLGRELKSNEGAELDLVLSGATVGVDYTLSLSPDGNTGVTVSPDAPLSSQNPTLVFTGGSQTAELVLTVLDDQIWELEDLTVSFGSLRHSVNGEEGRATRPEGKIVFALIDSSAPTGPVLDAQLEADVRSYAAEVQHGTLHVNRWKRVLEAFGLESYSDLEPTTLDEARVHVDIGRPRWVPVLAHMVALDAVNPQPTLTSSSVQVDAQVLATARSRAGETHKGAVHVNRWKRVLEAFGDADYPNIEPLTAAGAQVYANVWSGWTSIAAQLRLIEAGATTNPPPVVVAPTPEVSITAGSGVTEGGNAEFTVTATPAPQADLPVSVTVSQSGDFGASVGQQTVTIPTTGSVTLTVSTSDDSTDETDGSVTATVNTGSGYTVSSSQSAGTVAVSDNDAAPTGPVLDAQLESDVRSYAAETHHGTLHVNRWKRVLEAFGLESYPDLEPTTLDEARVHVDIGRPRWIPVLAHMIALDAVNPQPTLTPTSNPQVDAQVLATARSKAGETQHGAKHANRWKRVLEAFSDADYPNIEPITAAGAQVYANIWSGWTPIAAQLRLIEASATTNPPPVIPTVVIPPVVIPPTPEVNILSSSGGSEGATVSFTISANPAPSANLNVDISVVTTGDFGYGSIPSSVTIPPSGSVTLSITTTDDSVDESDGSVSLTLNSGNGYTVGALGSESVNVTDDDVTVAPVVVVPDPVVSITAGAGVTEGGNVKFTVTASPSPSADLPVSVTISQSGDFGATTGSRTVTIPTSGSVTFTIATSDDSTDESDGSVTATVNSGSGYTVSSSQSSGTVAVSDNDVPPTPVVSISAGNAVTEGGNVEFTVTASPRPTAALAVEVTISQDGDFGASTGSRTVTIPASGSVTLTISTSDDSMDEPDGSVTATLVDGAAYDLGSSKTGTVAVSDNDDPPPSSVTVSVADASGQEYEWVVDFSVTLSEASSEDVRVRFTTYAWRGATRDTLSQRAKMFIDYQLTDTTVVFAPGETERTVSVWLTDDSRSESEEHFTVELSDPQGASIGQGEATGTILDDD